MEEWLEVSVTVSDEVAEAVAEVLSEYAYHRGVAIEVSPEQSPGDPVTVRAYLPVDEEVRERQRAVEEALWHLGQIMPIPEPSFRGVAEADWAEAWKEHMSVLHIGRRIVVKPSWKSYTPEDEEVLIELDPGMAFGTGLHPTTRMCLTALEDFIRPGMEVLDLGTGSGILAIAATKLGASCVLAVDNDPVAVQVARENVRANGVEGAVQVVAGGLPEVEGGYDLVVVNILARVIRELLTEGLGTTMRPSAPLILAGILEGQVADLDEVITQTGLLLVEQRQIDDWVCLVTQTRNDP
jgi:ribosomal protein L11 methyltransferase